MKTLLIVLFIAIITGQATLLAPESKTIPIPLPGLIAPYEALYQAQVQVESGGNPNAYNAKEMATGIVQVRPIRLRDFNRRAGKQYTLSDCYNEKVSKEIWLFYASQYHPSQQETIARKWNGSGHMTKEYWKRVKNELKKQTK